MPDQMYRLAASAEDAMAAVTLVPARDANARPKARAMVTTAEKPSPEPPFSALDREVHAAVAPFTLGLSPAALTGAFFDWYLHLAFSPGRQLDLARQAILGTLDDCAFTVQSAFGSPTDPCARALPHDDRFCGSAWQSFPFNMYVTISCRSNAGGRRRQAMCAASASGMAKWPISLCGKCSIP